MENPFLFDLAKSKPLVDKKKSGSVPGDTFYQQPNELTLQLHTYDLRQKKKGTIAKAAPLLVANVPQALARNWLFQFQRGQN